MATILIVDDRTVNREFLVTLLGYGDHRLLQAGDGAEALAVARAEKPDLVIADVLMPTMDGYELVRQLRSDARLAQTRVIFWTAHYHEKEAKALARDCGVSAVITKPAEPEDVLRAVESALDRTPPAAEPPSPDEFDREHLRLLTDKISQKADELRATNERLSALIDLNLQLASEFDLQRLIQTFGRSARQIVGARYSITGILDADGTRFQSLFTSGMDAEMAARLGSQDPHSAPLHPPLREGRSIRLQNLGGAPVAIGFSASHPPIHAWLGAPIASPNRLYGYVGLIDKIGSDEFSAEDERLATILAAQVGRIYQNGSLYADVLRHAVELERETSARTQTEKALAEREEHIRLLLDSTAEGIYGIDLEGRCTFANSTCARLLGYEDTGQLLGRNMHRLMHHTRPDGAPYPAEECRILLAFRENQASHVDDEVLWRADGSSFPSEYWSHPISYEGRVAGSVVTFLDISQRRQLEDQFRQAQQRLRHIIVSSPAVLFTLSIVEGDFELTWISDNLLEVTGYRARDALGTQWWHTNIHPAERKWVTEQSRDALFAHGESVQEYRFRHGDGTYHWIRNDMRLIRDDAGRPTEVIGAWSDITDLKCAEEQRLELREQLEHSRKLEGIGRLAGGVAHDFNNLLGVIIGSAEMLQSDLPEDPALRGYTGDILNAALRGAELTRQLLAFSRQQVFQPTVLSLSDLVRDFERMLRRIIPTNIEIRTVLKSVGQIRADAGQIEQVIMNLAVNARDAMTTGGRLTIETADVELDESCAKQLAEVKPGPYALLAVIDSGHGMTPELMGRIFEPFFTTKERGKGTGLGLGTVHGIVKQSGGTISVYSEPGQGTTFKVYLPRLEEGVEIPPSTFSPGEMPRGTETILVVEDEASLRNIASEILSGLGYSVLVGENGEDAIRVSAGHDGPIHLLVTDVIMPGMGGRELVDRLFKSRPDLKVLYISGYTDDSVIAQGVFSSQMAFLQKPIASADLAQKVRAVLDAGQTTAVPELS